MENKNESNSTPIFRTKSLERISSPEDLNDYIRVANPGIWLILTGIVILLVGMIVWCVFGRLETKIDGVCLTENHRTVCYINESDIDKVQKGMKVIFSDGSEGKVTGLVREPIDGENVLTEYASYVSGFSQDSWLCGLTIDKTLSDGVEKVQIVVDTVKPIAFIIS